MRDWQPSPRGRGAAAGAPPQDAGAPSRPKKAGAAGGNGAKPAGKDGNPFASLPSLRETIATCDKRADAPSDSR